MRTSSSAFFTRCRNSAIQLQVAHLCYKLRVQIAALRSRDFRLLLAGQAVSLTGSQMQQVAVVWQLYLITKSPLSLGLLGAFRVTPILLLALGGGVAADAFDRKKLMLASQVGMMLASLGLFAATRAGVVTPGIIYGLAALGGVASAFDPPARQALLPQLVPLEALPNALSTYNIVNEVAAIGGPAGLGGALRRCHRGVRRVALVPAEPLDARALRRRRHGERGDAADAPADPHTGRAARPDDVGEHDVLHRRAAAGRGGGRRGGAP